ncbi:ankyrin repeat domain-containing protein [Ralstonia mannitolilytica]|uniref:ankyrin repeat domain-containing protein n=1 Tax=Ralstonia mannitolilytica TaxID=105219 RepID=UPI001C976F4D|nr:ankyrin repeat domain-containing protein [Ralstonia mannitolilytica]MBY4717561.1 ankyrin repeat domain-containing protein [Ralstonia mannitolilytica]
MISVIKLLIALLGSSILAYTYSFLIKQLGIYPKFSIKKIIYKKKFQRLKEAALKTDLQALQELQASGFNINEEDHIALHMAASRGNLPIVKLCVKQGASIQAKEMALVEASLDGFHSIVEYLIDNGVNPQAYKDYALIISSSTGHFELAEHLISKGCDPYSIINFDPQASSKDRGFFIGAYRQNFAKAKEWAEKYINAQELAKKLDKELQAKTTTKTGRIKI